VKVYIENNLINRIASFNLANLSNVTKLDLSYNKLDFIEINAFNGLKTLQELKLAGTGLVSLDQINFKSIPQLIDLDVSENENLKINNTVFTNLKKLTTLKLASINLTSMSALNQVNFKAVEIFDLSNNNLALHKDIIQMTSLIKLNLSYGNIYDIEVLGLNKMKMLTKLYLRQNSIRVIKKKAFYCNIKCRLEHLDLRDNLIESIEVDAFLCLGNLKFLYLSGNKLSNQTRLEVKDLNKIVEIYASNCNLAFMPEFNFKNELSYLYLDHNRITELVESQFYYLKQLTFLDLSYNFISSIRLDYGLSIMSGLSSVREIKFNNNRIETSHLPLLGFASLTNLRKLYLGSNRILYITKLTFQRLEKLEILDLSFNNILSIQAGSFQYLTNLKTLNLNFRDAYENSINSTLADKFIMHADNLTFVHLSSVSVIQDNLDSIINSMKPVLERRKVNQVKYFLSLNLIVQYTLEPQDYYQDCIFKVSLVKHRFFLNLKNDEEVKLFLEQCAQISLVNYKKKYE
jgi:Leucine-rich repeat (LRR) protein